MAHDFKFYLENRECPRSPHKESHVQIHANQFSNAFVSTHSGALTSVNTTGKASRPLPAFGLLFISMHF